MRPASKVSTRDRATVRGRSGGVCERCREQRAEHVHHRRARGMGGNRSPVANGPANLLHLCVDDHMWIESRRTEALDEGLLVRQHQDPQEIPVLLAQGWVYLRPDGTIEVAA